MDEKTQSGARQAVVLMLLTLLVTAAILSAKYYFDTNWEGGDWIEMDVPRRDSNTIHLRWVWLFAQQRDGELHNYSIMEDGTEVHAGLYYVPWLWGTKWDLNATELAKPESTKYEVTVYWPPAYGPAPKGARCDEMDPDKECPSIRE